MRILQVIPSLQLAGAETMCENLSYELVAQGHSVMVVSLYHINSAITERMMKNGVNLVFLNKKRGFDFSCIKKLKRIVCSFKPDIIHTHLYALKYGVFAGHGIPIIHTLHSVASKENTRFQRWVNRSFYKKGIVLPVALNEENKKSFDLVYKIDGLNIPIVPNGVDLGRCLKKDDYGIHGTVRLLHIGRFANEKNHMELLRSVKELLTEGFDVHLDLIGDGALRSNIESFVCDNNMNGSVSLLGPQENVFGFLHDADIFVLPSLYEGLPMTIIEAMGTGLPIVASRVGGIPNIVIDHENGLLCDTTSSSITSAIKAFINNEELRRKCGVSAKEKAEAFSSKRMCNRYTLLYEEMLKNAGF